MKTVYVIHGWGGGPNEPLHQWLKENLKQKGYNVVVPEMPDTDEPHIKAWIDEMKNIIDPNEETILIGHSIGCQAILRYLGTLSDEQKVGGVVLLAPATNLNMEKIESEGEESITIARGWIDTPIDFAKAKDRVKGNITAIFSDDDPVVPLSESQILAEKLGAEIIIEHNKGHFTEEEEFKGLASLLNAVDQA